MECPCDSIRLLKSDDAQFIIYGPASAEVKDKEGDKILAKGLAIALPQLLKRGRVSLAHEDILVGAILPSFESEGKLYKTEVANKRLMLVADIWNDTQASQRTRQQILDKQLKSFSISGEVYHDDVKKVCDQSGCVREISKLDLHAVTICKEGMNPAAKFEILQKEDNTVAYITNATPPFPAMELKISKTVRDYIMLSDDEATKADYPWEDCIADQKASGHSEDSAKRICAAIKNRTVAHKMKAESVPLEKAFEGVVQKVLTDSDFSYILGKMIDSHASRTEVHEEVQKAMTTETPKPPEEAPKAAPPADGAGGGMAEVKQMCSQMMAILQQLLEHEKAEAGGGRGGDMGKQASADAQAKKEFEDLKKKVTEQDALIAKLQAGAAGATPRPDNLNKSELEKGVMSIEELLKNPEKLAKTSASQIETMTGGM